MCAHVRGKNLCEFVYSISCVFVEGKNMLGCGGTVPVPVLASISAIMIGATYAVQDSCIPVLAS